MATGKNNGRWNGGVSEYPNHAKMKKTRLIKFGQVNWKCEICGKPASVIHHKDKTKHNHEIKNLMALCSPCHHKLHKDVLGGPCKYGKLSLEKLGKKYNISGEAVRDRFIKGKPLDKKVYKYGDKSLIELGKIYNLSHVTIKNKIINNQPFQKTSKFIRMYGYTIKEIANKLSISISAVYKMHIYNKLKKTLTGS